MTSSSVIQFFRGSTGLPSQPLAVGGRKIRSSRSSLSLRPAGPKCLKKYFKIWLQKIWARPWWHMTLKALEKQKQADLCEYEARLVYRTSARSTQRNPILTPPTTTKKKKKMQARIMSDWPWPLICSCSHPSCIVPAWLPFFVRTPAVSRLPQFSWATGHLPPLTDACLQNLPFYTDLAKALLLTVWSSSQHT